MKSIEKFSIMKQGRPGDAAAAGARDRRPLCTADGVLFLLAARERDGLGAPTKVEVVEAARALGAAFEQGPPRSAASPRRTLANNVHVHLRQLQRVERVKVRTYAATGTRAAGGGGSRYTRRMQARADGGGRGGKL